MQTYSNAIKVCRGLAIAIAFGLSTVSHLLSAHGGEPASWELENGEVVSGAPLRSGYEKGVGRTLVFLSATGEEVAHPASSFSGEAQSRFAEMVAQTAREKKKAAALESQRRQQLLAQREQEAERRQMEAQNAKWAAAKKEADARAARFEHIEQVMAAPQDFKNRVVDCVMWISGSDVKQCEEQPELFVASVCGGADGYKQVPWYGSTKLRSYDVNFVLTREQAAWIIKNVPALESQRFECTMRSETNRIGGKDYKVFTVLELRCKEGVLR